MPRRPRTTSFTLSPAERWVVHAALLDRLGFGNGGRDGRPNPYVSELAIVDKLESSDPTFNHRELKRIRKICLNHADQAATPATDRARACDVVEQINGILHSSSPASDV